MRSRIPDTSVDRPPNRSLINSASSLLIRFGFLLAAALTESSKAPNWDLTLTFPSHEYRSSVRKLQGCTRVKNLGTLCVNSSVARFARKFFWKFPGRWAILQLLCSQGRRKLQEGLTQQLSSKPCDRAIDALCIDVESYRANIWNYYL